MALVAYSDSEGSDNESPANPPSSTTKSTAPLSSTKPTFRKFVDRSNPHKIQVSLPTSATGATGATNNDIDADAPPAKRARTGGGGGAFADFNSLLPAPKNPAAAGKKDALKKGLGRGISLKTGAAPAFSREMELERGEGDVGGQDEPQATGSRGDLPRSDDSGAGDPPAKATNEVEVKLVGNPMMFRPLSVANKKKKKTVVVSSAAATTSTTAKTVPKTSVNGPAVPSKTSTAPYPTPPAKLKVSLFSLGSDDDPAVVLPAQENYYPEIDNDVQPPDEEHSAHVPAPHLHSQEPSRSSSNGPQTLDAIANDLNLSESARRQLFGRRQKGGKNAAADLSSVQVANFNIEQEYATGEAIRAAGETVQHRPVNKIAPGKHNLKQLVNNAVSQSDALEESFAAGKRNRQEAGSRYGW